MYYDDIKLHRELVYQEKSGDLQEHELHHHDVLEFHVLQENEARFQLVGKAYEGQPGDVFLFRPFEPHWNLAKDPDQPIRWTSILFSPAIARIIPDGYKLIAPFYAVEAVSPLIPASSPAAQAIQRLAAQAVEEERSRTIGWEAKQLSLFIDILVHTFRHSFVRPSDAAGRLPGGEPDAAASLDDGIIRAIGYVLAHFSEDIDIERLIPMTGRKRTFFYKRFKAITGVTPNVLIHRLRMQLALYLLGRTDRPVTEIAFHCGYASLSYFNKHFKQYQGMSPREYRKSVHAAPATALPWPGSSP